MKKHLLLVDDDVNLVNTLSRNLKLSYEVQTANSGKEALAILQGGAEFGVIIVDMRMPELSGIDLIKVARPIAKDAVFIMLTGNQDTATASAAINEGQVFRFLNKPCEIAKIKETVNAAFDQHALVTAEKILLHKTFVGAIEVMTDVIEATQNEVGSAQLVDQTFMSFAMVMGQNISWEHRTATKLALVGMSMLPPEVRMKMKTESPTTPEYFNTMDEIAEISARLIQHIPRLDLVAKIILAQIGSVGAINPKQCDVPTAGAFLKTAVYWELLKRRGVPHIEKLSQIKTLLPQLPNEVMELLDEAEEPTEDASVEIATLGLLEGMELSADFRDAQGMLMVAAGTRLTKTMIERLQHSKHSSTSVKLTIKASSVNLASAEA